MIDELKEEEIVNKVGGRFKLSTLIQKRMIALNQGARALVDIAGHRQDDGRDPGDHAGEDLPRPLRQAADGRADRRAGEQRRNRRSYPTGRLNRALRGLAILASESQGPRIAGRSKGGSAPFPTRILSGLSRTDTGDVGASRG